MRELRSWRAPVALFALALVLRLWAASLAPFPPNEGSAYYVGVARNVLEGRGLVSDAAWSYATPPLVLPKPAFELWLPLASFVSLAGMAVLGPTLAGAQAAMSAVGALVAPLAWLVARQEAERRRLEAGRAHWVALGSGVLVAVLGPFLVAAAGPDSTTPFLVLGVAACLLMPRVIAAAGARGATARAFVPGAALGVALGLAYLARQEAVYLALAFVILGVVAARGAPGGEPLALGRMVLPVVAAGALTVAPWLVRNAATFGTLFPGQALENVYLTSNEEIFAYAARPTLEGFLAQGPAAILGNQLNALRHNLVDVLLLPAMPVAALGIAAAAALWFAKRRPHHASDAAPDRARQVPGALDALLVAGTLTYLGTSLLVPVATLWGTFMHAAGPLLVGLTVAAVLGLDSAVAAIRRARRWTRVNAWLAPAAAIAVTVPLSAFQVVVVGAQSRALQERYSEIAAHVSALPELATRQRNTAPAARADLISDHPIWLAETLRRPVLALPDEPVEDLLRLAGDFDVPLVLIIDERGRYPEILDATASPCLRQRSFDGADRTDLGHLFTVTLPCPAS